MDAVDLRLRRSTRERFILHPRADCAPLLENEDLRCLSEGMALSGCARRAHDSHSCPQTTNSEEATHDTTRRLYDEHLLRRCRRRAALRTADVLRRLRACPGL